MNFPLLWRTLAPLRWEQWLYRPWRIAQKQLYRRIPATAGRWQCESRPAPRVPEATLTTIREILLADFAHLTPPLDEVEKRVEELRAGRFTFLNRTLEIGAPDWNRRYQGHLWNYHLHYFSYAVGCARWWRERNDHAAIDVCRRLIESWIEQARIGISDGWDAYPTSLRLVNWIYTYALIADRYEDREFLERWHASIFRQMDYLAAHLEFHLLANHLLKNVKALVIGGLFFNHPGWLARGERLLWREFDEQILGDGGHYERSPMYHAQVMCDFLECVRLLKAFGRPIPSGTNERLQAMASFLEALSYPDGTLALFNDAANTEETRPRPILEAARRIHGDSPTGPRSEFPQAGYYLWTSPDETEKIIVDAGPPAVSYNLAHAHCDLLSFELRVGGKPWIVDTGIHGYGGDRYREYCRSTRAHNTIMIDGREQSEIWGTFRMGGQARLIEAGASGEREQWEFHGAYRPYHDRRLCHERRIRRDRDGTWTIEDTVRGGPFKRVDSFLHLTAEVRIETLEGGALVLEREGLRYRLEPFGNASVTVHEAAEGSADGWYFPDFGIARPGRTIRFTYDAEPGDSFGFRMTPIQ